MFNQKIQYPLRLSPVFLLTRLVGRLARYEGRRLTRWAIILFIRLYRVNMQEALRPKPEQYRTFNDFFPRELVPGSRPIDRHPHSMVFPADGFTCEYDPVQDEHFFQAKGQRYSLHSLLASHGYLTRLFSQGCFFNIYLPPGAYHRVHMPCDGMLREMIYVPGTFYSVRPSMVKNVPGIFASNERIICIFDTPFGSMAQILLGAKIVGSIETVWLREINSPGHRSGGCQIWHYPAEGDESIRLKKIMGLFRMGSAVIDLFSSDKVRLESSLSGYREVRQGQKMATVNV
ncbi:archaetidylserine decarboxylase [Klebsiella pneumoniae]|uniref:archaetidylserine decarboxylase n=1 Tax=Klebsiella pneumoniae TaxID=573 RepID=UPI001C7FBD1E|nr:archaetidylserine decarboxylase [Klebsiella pneumoniae]MDE8408080.1 archaetidylserine decarboxylase [Klebsiella pneumoniae]HBV4966358.1 phosphatidylserine decarboxylase [Klebsiella pneumoniae]